MGVRDPVIGGLQRIHHGQRPVLFHSPYEAAAWAIISARRPAQTAAKTRSEISERFGATFSLAGETMHAFPQPDRLVDPRELPGLNRAKVERLAGVARAALAGQLDVPRLHELGPKLAHQDLQQLKGIGPFYAGLIVLRASGFADALLLSPEPRVLANAAELYGLDRPPTLEQFARMAEPWRPFRTWATVLIRLAGDRARQAGAASGSA